MIQRLLHYGILLVWGMNGLYCKVLNFVPRHEAIVGRILGEDYARLLTLLIGLAELVMVIWVWSGYRRQLNAMLQIGLVITMNLLETLLVPDLLLWGRWNAFFALIFVILVYVNNFVLLDKTDT